MERDGTRTRGCRAGNKACNTGPQEKMVLKLTETDSRHEWVLVLIGGENLTSLDLAFLICNMRRTQFTSQCSWGLLSQLKGARSGPLTGISQYTDATPFLAVGSAGLPG